MYTMKIKSWEYAIAFQKSIGRRISAINSTKIMLQEFVHLHMNVFIGHDDLRSTVWEHNLHDTIELVLESL